MNSEKRYLTSAFLLLLSSIIVKIIGAVYKIPLTAYIGAVGRGYFATAYNVYIPLHAIIMGALPIALSRLISKYNARNNLKMLSSLKRGAMSLFALAGFLGMIILIALAKPYSVFVASSSKSTYTILVIAPSLFFSCLAACYRGFYEGYLDMKPTSVSQTLEAIFKLIFGLVFAKYAMAYLFNCYAQNGEIFGVKLKGEEQALSFIYPYSSAAAMLGVTAGSFVSLVYVIIYDKINRPELIKTSGRDGRRELFDFSLPIMISCSVQSVFQFLDTSSIQLALKGVNQETLKNAFSSSLKLVGTVDGDIVTYVWGMFCTALDFKNLIPGITMALGVCAVPAICREYESKNFEKTEALINSVFKYTAVLSIFIGVFTALCSKEILSVFYFNSSPDIVIGCEKLVIYFSLSAPIYSLASVAVYCVQAVGKPEKSILSYIISGIIRCCLNYALIRNEKLLLLGAVISGAAGYFVLFVMNVSAVKRVSKSKFSVLNNLFKPFSVGVLSFILCKITYNEFYFTKNIYFNLLIQFAIFVAIYYILCVFFRIFNFKEIFCVLKLKKMA